MYRFKDYIVSRETNKMLMLKSKPLSKSEIEDGRYMEIFVLPLQKGGDYPLHIYGSDIKGLLWGYYIKVI